MFDVTNNIPVPLNTSETYPSLSTNGTTLSFTISGLASSVTTEGIVTDITTSATAISFGSLAVGGTIEGAQRLTVTTNAAEGYQVLLKQTQNMTSYGGVEIVGVDGTNVAPAAWAIPSNAFGGYGYHAGDDSLSGNPTRFSVDDTYAKLESSAKEVAFNNSPVENESIDVVYRVEISNQQQAGSYAGSLEYIIIPIY